MTLDDYKPIVEVAKNAGTRIQCLFVLAEMDRLNILRHHPSTTWMGANWDNSKNISPEQIEIMDYVKENAAYLEFGLHGVGHEHWVNGKKVRAEWYDLEHDTPWNKDTILAHIQSYKAIMAQLWIDPRESSAFPGNLCSLCIAEFIGTPNLIQVLALSSLKLELEYVILT